MLSKNDLFNDLGKKETSLTVAGHHQYEETDNINFEQSSLKSHPLWVPL